MEPAPTSHEVERQLDRMLASGIFKAAPRLSPLLRYIVLETLAEEAKEEGQKDPAKLTEHQIGFAVFDNYSSDRTDVRANATALRNRIRKYYTECGTEDPVLIQIPPGGYRAVFSHNPKSPADRLFREGCARINCFEPSEGEHRSLSLFKEAIRADPNHAGAHAAKAEAELREVLYRRVIPPNDPVAAAEMSAMEALRIQPRAWSAHIALGVVHSCRHKWEKALGSFNSAMDIAPLLARDHFWYQGFQMAIGRDQDALRLARSRAEEVRHDPSPQIALGFFLYLARRFDEAEERLSEVAETFPQSWLARLVLACVYLAQERATEALVSVEQAHGILCDQNGLPLRRNEIFPGLLNLCRTRSGEEVELRLAREALKTAGSWDRWAADEKTNGVLPGDADEEPGHYDMHIPFWTPLQIALGFIALEKNESAIEALSRAIDEGDPLSVLIPRLPLLDPLRGLLAFQALIERLSLSSVS